MSTASTPPGNTEHKMKSNTTDSKELLPASAGSGNRGTQWYHRVYDVLARDLQAPEGLRMSFVWAHTDYSPVDEFRFQGVLGFGGKYRRKTNTVDCYPEDETPGRLDLIAETNASLASLTADPKPPAGPPGSDS